MPGERGGKAGRLLKNALLLIADDIENLMQLQIYRAKLTKEYFDALVDEGFSKQEALELCKTFNPLGG